AAEEVRMGLLAHCGVPRARRDADANGGDEPPLRRERRPFLVAEWSESRGELPEPGLLRRRRARPEGCSGEAREPGIAGRPERTQPRSRGEGCPDPLPALHARRALRELAEGHISRRSTSRHGP